MARGVRGSCDSAEVSLQSPLYLYPLNTLIMLLSKHTLHSLLYNTCLKGTHRALS